MNTGEIEKKILKQFRLQPSVLGELESLADDSGLDMTEIVEVAINNVRPVVEKMMRSRLDALEKSGALRKSSPNQLKILTDSIDKKLLKKATKR